ncbi:MAG TPA: Ig-like domain-containing protein [Gemmatimonadales bacterium]|nr:Ig-like domain-containing protein [Gemmatimonadales bacterium]
MIRGIVVGAIAGAILAACSDESTGPGDLTPVASITISPVSDTLLTQQRLRLEVRAFDSEGGLLSDRPVTWESADPAIASVTAGGVLLAIAPGTTVIRAMALDVGDSVTVTTRTLLLEHVYAGGSVSCGLEATGEAWCWGNVGPDGYGNGSLDTTRQNVPARAAVGHTFGSLALSRTSVCGIAITGPVLCWGKNDNGQLGDGTTTAQGAPIPISQLSGIVQLAAGESHFCARSSAGSVSCWGDNAWFQAGQPIRGPVSQPQPVALSGPASDITADFSHSCALVAGQSYCWGSDNARQLGNDTIYDRLVPALAATGDGVSRTWSEVEASNHHTCGRDATGAVFCWGLLEGQGDHNSLQWVPTRRFPTITATDIAGGWLLQCAVSDQQAAFCDGETYDRVELGASGAVVSVVVAGDQACVLEADGTVACELGTNARGALSRVPLPAQMVQLVASDQEACALDSGGAVNCWSTWNELVPQRVFEPLTATGVYAGSGPRICIIAQSSAVACRSTFDGIETTEPTGGLTLVSLAVGDNHTCGLTPAGAAWCWGRNTHGQLGDGTTTDRTAPVAVEGSHVFTRITAGKAHTCGLTTAAQIYCWGYGSLGNMGDDRRDASAVPVSVDGAPSLTKLGAGAVAYPRPTCGIDGSGSAWCWPASFDTSSARQINGATGLVTITNPCGLRTTGEMLCWGSNYSGWFGNGTYNIRTESAVQGGNGIRFAEASFGPTGTACGIGVDGATYCWGNAYGTSHGSPESNGEYATLPLRLYGSP